jgi:polyisoprenyl-phosphate glycosyltransferase
MKIKILIPIFNDWESINELLKNIDLDIKYLNHEFSVTIVNDASTEIKNIDTKNFQKIYSIELVHMIENRGHARCIATGLKYIFENKEFDYIIPMDGDGEDRPKEIKDFVEYIQHSPGKLIVGERAKRSENLIFRFCYHIHKILTLVFTGRSIKFGNFTCIPKLTVKKMLNEKTTWSSFSGALTKVEKDKLSILSIRGKRYFGPSKMSFINLLKHSLSIIAVFRINVLIRSFFFLIIYLFLILSKISLITLIPILLVFIMNVVIFNLAKRENIDEFNNSLLNIKSVEKIK